ncbi:IS4 family transposase [Halanaerobaculum tunisiense]
MKCTSEYTILLYKFIDIIGNNFLDNLVDKYDSDYKVHKLKTKKHLLCLLYYHLTEKDSLEDFVSELKGNNKLNEVIPEISKSQISRKNEDRDYKIFYDIFQHLFERLKSQTGYRKALKEIGSVKLIDSSTVSCCLSLFPWAKFRSSKGGIKLHTLYDLNTEAPENIIISNAVIHDKEILNNLTFNPSYTYIFDRAYLDYQKFDELIAKDIYFVTKLKSNAKIKYIRKIPLNKSDEQNNILLDADVILGSEVSVTKMEQELRLIKIKVKDRNNNPKVIKIVINRFDLDAQDISALYKDRWQIELFFKWIKQHLKIKRFFGHNKNAVFTQIYSALILFILLKLIKKKTKFSGSLLKLTRKIKYSIFMIVSNNFN